MTNKWKSYNLIIEQEDWDELQKLAEKMGMKTKIAHLIRIAIKEYLKKK